METDSMNQANSAHTTTTSAPGTHPAASFPPVQAAHITLISALASLKPHRIIGSYAADRFDILERAEHLEKVLAAGSGYTKTTVARTPYLWPRSPLAPETPVLAGVSPAHLRAPQKS